MRKVLKLFHTCHAYWYHWFLQFYNTSSDLDQVVTNMTDFIDPYFFHLNRRKHTHTKWKTPQLGTSLTQQPLLFSSFGNTGTYFNLLHRFWGFPTRKVYIYYIPCLRYTILVGNPQFPILWNTPRKQTLFALLLTYGLSGIAVRCPLGKRQSLVQTRLSQQGFSRLCHTSHLNIGSPVATLPGAWHY